jgi:hypothetical protein
VRIISVESPETGKTVLTVELEGRDEDALMEAFVAKTWGWGEEDEGFGHRRELADPEKSLAEAKAWQDGSDPWLFENRPAGRVCLNRSHTDIEKCKADHHACVIGLPTDERVDVTLEEIDGQMCPVVAVRED